MNRKNKNQSSTLAKVVGFLVLAMLLNLESVSILLALVLMLAPMGLIVWLVFRAVKNRNTGSDPRREDKRFSTAFRRNDLQIPDNCTHKDKAIHHVRRGKEMDPWDRPDIDISKYQRPRAK